MFKKVLYFIANSIWLLMSIKQYDCFKRSCLKMGEVQKKLLSNIIKRNAETEFGKKYNFNNIYSISNFKSKVPITTYDFYSSYIDLICNGKQKILTKDEIFALVPSSGSTAASKFIPYTYRLRRDFEAGIKPWVFNLFTNRKKLLFGSAYWSITPLGQIKKSGWKIPIGFEDDSGYFGMAERLLFNILFPVPKEVCKIEDITAFRYVTLLFLLRDRYLSFISIWNPTFLSLLLKPALEWWQVLVNDIRNGTISTQVNLNSAIRKTLLKRLSKDVKRAEELSSVFERWNKKGSLSFNDSSLYEEIWPNLALVSCWADGNAEHHIKDLKVYFPNVEIQPKGLIATEGFVSLPLIGEKGNALSINSHFFEFIDIKKDDKIEEKNNYDTKLAHQLEMGKCYSVIITTNGGLYRYRLQDVIKVVGFKGGCPLIIFVGKEDKISSLFGEKLNECHVSSVLNEIFKRHCLFPSFYMVAPEKSAVNDDYFYTLFLKFDNRNNWLDGTLQLMVEEIEEKLQENYHYRYCRRLGQLSKLKLFIINSNHMALETYMHICQSSGQRLGNIKPPILNTKIGWSKIFVGRFVEINIEYCNNYDKIITVSGNI